MNNAILVEKLNYFSKTHFDAENEHAMYEEEGEQQLHAIKLTPQEREKAFALVNQVYTISHIIADASLKQLEKEDSLKYLPHIYPDPANTSEEVKRA